MTDKKDHDAPHGFKGSERPSTAPSAPGATQPVTKDDKPAENVADTEFDRARKHDKGREQDPAKHDDRELKDEEKGAPIVPPQPNPGAAEAPHEQKFGDGEKRNK